MKLENLTVKLFADGANLAAMVELYRNPLIKGFTTNPTLMRKAGITDYRAFGKELLAAIPDRPISFEVFADQPGEMERQALELASWGKNVFVKIPVTNTQAEPTYELVRRLSEKKVQLNVTALLTVEQVREVATCLSPSVPSYVSLFAGRIADTGIDPIPMVAQSVDILKALPRAELIWASPREVLNILQANNAGCQVITVSTDLLAKLPMWGKDLNELSLDTVRMFRRDAEAAGFVL